MTRVVIIGGGPGGYEAALVGAQLGADPTAIYRHFSNKRSLMRSLLDEITRMSLEQVTAEPEDWKGRLTQLSIATQELFAAYPAIGIEASVLTTNGPGELDVIEFILDAFSRAGLSGDELVRHYAWLGAHILSSAGAIARDRSERGGDVGLNAVSISSCVHPSYVKK